jgi:23S rRNA (uridine2552-2'-O)-methyltransferase
MPVYDPGALVFAPMPKAARTQAAKKHRSNRAWIERHLTDPFVKRATEHGYRSRAAYKLTEIDDRDRFLRPGATVVDLGAAPGSWTQVVCERLARGGTLTGKVIALDLLPLEPLAGVDVIQGDFREESVEAELEKRLQGAKVDAVLSDMAPNLSGIAAADAARSLHVAELALDFAVKHLRADGVFLVKAFHGSGYSQYVERLKRSFRAVSVRKPEASRETSAEVYLLARGLRAVSI